MYKILLIYNGDAKIQDLNILLTKSGFNTYLAEDVFNGIEIAKIYTPDLILCFMAGDGHSGIEVVRKLTSNERTKIIPLIYVAEEPDISEMRLIMNSGADDYLSFPLEDDALVESINVRLQKYNAIKQKYDVLSNETIEANGDLPEIKDHILVKIGTNLRIIKYSDIVCVNSLKEYSKVLTRDSKKVIIRKSLKKWIEMLPASHFLQIHRSAIINLEFIENMKLVNDRSYEVYLKFCNEPLQVSVRNAKKLKKRFEV